MNIPFTNVHIPGTKTAEEKKLTPMDIIGAIISLLTRYGAAFMMAGQDKAKIKATTIDMVKEIATPKNIDAMGHALISALSELRKKTGKRYLITIEPTAENDDACLMVWTRSDDLTVTTLEQTIYLAKIQQEDFFKVIDLVFKAATNTPEENGHPKLTAGEPGN